MRKKLIACGLAAALALSLAAGCSKHTEAPVYDRVIASETAYLESLQMEDGAFAEYGIQDDNTAYIMPYFNEFAVMALLEGGNDYADCARRYLDWHFAHLNTAAEDVSALAGTIYDYDVTLDKDGHILTEVPHEEVGVGKYYDSTDSYAALFLACLAKYYEVTQDKEYITGHADDIKAVAAAIFGTLDDGLTYATPAYKIKYVMDNSEVYYGLEKAIGLYQAVWPEDAAGEAQLAGLADTIQGKIVNEMWTELGYGHFWYYFDENGMHGSYYWTHFYPDATSQVFPAIFGVISPTDEKAVHCWDYFNQYWSNGKAKHRWEELDTTDEYAWSDLCIAAVKMGDTDRAEKFMESYLKKYGRDHQYPAYVGDSGKILLAAYLLKGQSEGAGK